MYSVPCMANTNAIAKCANIDCIKVKDELDATVEEVFAYHGNELFSLCDKNHIETLDTLKIEPGSKKVAVDEPILITMGALHENVNEEEREMTVQEDLIKADPAVLERKRFKMTGEGTEDVYTKREDGRSMEVFEEKPTVIKTENEIRMVKDLYCNDESKIQILANTQTLNTYAKIHSNIEHDNARDIEQSSREENKPLQYVKKEEEVTIEYGVLDEKSLLKNGIDYCK